MQPSSMAITENYQPLSRAKKFVNQTNKSTIHVDAKNLEAMLQTVHVSEFVLTEIEPNCYTMEVITRTKGGSLMGHYQVDRIRNGGAKVWKNAESCVQWVKTITPEHINVAIVFVLQKPSTAEK